MPDIFDRLLAANKLPPGHYEKKNAQKEIDAEYALCRTKENELMKKYKMKHGLIDLNDAAKICYNICNHVSIPQISMVYINSSEVHPASCAHYNPRNKTIHFKNSWIISRSLLHELSHHLHRYFGDRGPSHGPEFCVCLEMIYETFSELRHGKTI